VRNMVSAIVTIPPYAPFIRDVAGHSIVSGLRLNTVMPVKDSLEDVVKRLKEEAGDKDLWIDLKCRQLRVKTYGVPPFTEIALTHNLSVETPVKAYFSDGQQAATVLAVDGNKLIMQEGPERVVGPGESVNIVHPSLKVEGYFTDTDMRYIEASQKAGVHNYMLSFVEGKEDVDGIYKLDPDAKVVAKIESQKGLSYAAKRDEKIRLMAARGDLYIEVKRPHQIIQAVEDIVKHDPDAIAASRIFSSLAESYEPSCADIGDADNLLRIGYRTFMFGDDICMRRDTIINGLNLFAAMAERYNPKDAAR